MSKRLTEKLQLYAKAYKEPPYGREIEGTVELLEEAANKLTIYETFFNEKLKDILMDYFDIKNDVYAYNLTREKEAFSIGTMSFDDFEEFNEETIDDIVEFIKRKN